MSVTRDATASSSANASSLTFSHTVANLPNRALVVGVNFRTNTTVTLSSITYAASGLTIAASGVDVNQCTSVIGYILNPPTGTNNVVITLSASARVVGHSASFRGGMKLGVAGGATFASVANPNITLAPYQIRGIELATCSKRQGSSDYTAITNAAVTGTLYGTVTVGGAAGLNATMGEVPLISLQPATVSILNPQTGPSSISALELAEMQVRMDD